jgi:Holliday junction resolvasome RuvABC ATP-dependent DNA helicase subunit
MKGSENFSNRRARLDPWRGFILRRDDNTMRRPNDFHGFYGQRPKVRFLKKQLQGAQALGQPMPHLLITGPTGGGKTRLANALAQEAGAQRWTVHGKASPSHLCGTLVQMSKGDFLFCDEAHSLGRESQQALYEVIDHGRMKDLLDDKTIGQRDKDGWLIIAPITIILATDQPSKLLQALRKRMEHTIPLPDYPVAELVAIGEAKAKELDVLVSPQGMHTLAEAAQGRPRRVEQNLKGMKRHFHNQKRQLTTKDVREYFRAAEIDAQGLDAQQQLYMQKLANLGRASLNTMAALLNTDAEEVEANVEAGLVKLGFVCKLRVGRQLTPAGEKWLRAYQAKQSRRRALKQEGDQHQ